MGSGTELAMINTVMADNTVDQVSGKTDMTVDLVYSLFGNGKNTFSSASIDQYTWGAGNIHNQPYFVKPDTGNYTLTRWSPANLTATASVTVRGNAYSTPATDLAGNARPYPEATSPDMGAYESVVAVRAPIVSVIVDGIAPAADIDFSNNMTSLSAYWPHFENDNTITYQYAIGSEGINDIQNWSNTSSDTAFTATGLSLKNSVTYYVSVRGTNTGGAVSDTTTSDGVFIDNEKPVISLVSETATDVDWFAGHMADTIVVTATDNYAIKSYHFGYGYVPGITSSNWTDADTNTAALDISALREGELFYSNVRVKDWTGQVAYGSSDGFRVDRGKPVLGTVEIAAGVDSVLLKWSGFSDALSGLKNYYYYLSEGAIETPIIPRTTVGLVDSIKFKIQDLVVGKTYYVPFVAVDTAGNENNPPWLTFVYDLHPGLPTVVSISQDAGTKLTAINDQTITFTASEKISAFKLKVQSALNDTIIYESTGTDQSIDVKLLAPFTSGDTITINITEMVDMAGLTTYNQTFDYIVDYLGDYDSDDEISLDDLTTFVQNWYGKDYTKELGPAVGTVPYLKPHIDGKYNIHDGMIFSRMWRWDRAKVGKLLARQLKQQGQALNYNIFGNYILVYTPEGTHGIDIRLEYPPAKIELSVPDEPMDNTGMTLDYNDPERGLLVIHSASISDRKKPVRINLKNLVDDEVALNLNFVFQGEKRQVLGAGASYLKAMPIPTEFALRQNYPNPFNPVTEILYDLPADHLVELFVYDLLGREVIQLVNAPMTAGYHRVTWHAKDAHGQPVSAGIYFYQMRAGSFVRTQKMILLK